MNAPRPITAEYFKRATGQAQRMDDLERCNCPKAGEPGHWQCGWNDKAGLPFFMTGDLNTEKTK